MSEGLAVAFHDIVKIYPTPERGQVNALGNVSLVINHGNFLSLF